ncbi:MAG: hypothetical protein RLZZ214_770 [Verrucomicrobiota bacterium]
MRIIPLVVIACVMTISLTRGFAMEPPVRILPLGDSLTYGVANTSVQGGYRTRLHNLLTAADYNVDFVGTFTDDPNQGAPDRDHQGLRGVRTDALQTSLPGWLNAVEDPDVVLLLIGTNDIWQNVPVSQVQTGLSAIIADIATRRPYAKIIVSSLPQRTDIPGYEALQVSYNAGIPGIVAQHVALGRQVSFVDMHAVLTPFDLSSDGVHPSTGGYEKMADAWAPEIAKVISPKGTANPPLIARIRPGEDLTHVQTVFSKPVADDTVSLGNFSLSGGLTVTGAVLDATTKRIVTLTTSPQTRGLVYSLAVSGVKDRTARQTKIAPQSMANFSQGAITNGSFENGYAGWTGSGNQDVESGPLYNASDGAYLVAFNGSNSTPGGILTQSFATTPGQIYQLALDCGVFSNSGGTQRLQVIVEGATTLVSDTVSVQRVGNNSTTWVYKSYLFTANSISTDLHFTDVSTITNDIDLLLDNVRITARDTLSLAVTSSPFGGANLTASPADTGGIGAGSTGLIRSYNFGTSVTVTAPATFAGRPFLTWRKFGVNLPGSNPNTVLTLNANQTLDAVYDSLPVATAQSVAPVKNQAKIITLAGTDPDGDSLLFALVSSPGHGVLTGTPPNLSYTPNANYQGPDSFTFTTFDGIESSAPATVSITVQPVDAFTQWLDGFGLTAGAGEDSDQDSISNAVEYVIGGNPANTPDNGLLPAATFVTADPDGDLLDSDYLLFTYRRSLAAHTDPAVAMEVEWNTALDAPWNSTVGAPGVVTTIDTSLGPDTDLVKVHIPYSLSTSSVLFARLRVVVSAP